MGNYICTSICIHISSKVAMIIDGIPAAASFREVKLLVIESVD
jgi:hypothetical protein